MRPATPPMHRTAGGLSKDAVALLAILLFSLVVRWDLILERQLPARGDTLTGFLPHKSFSARTVRSGELPLWDPHIFAGQPFLADPQTAVFSPFSIPFYLLPLTPAFVVYILLKHVLAGAFTYGFLRTIGSNRPGALLGAFAFTFSSTMFRQIPWQEVASTTVWMPLLFWLCELLIRNPRRAGIASLAACTFAFENLAGHPQLTYYIYMALGLYCLIRLLARSARERSARPLATSGGVLLAVVAVGAGLAAVQVLPLKEFMDATRYGETFDIQAAADPASSVSEIPRLFLGGIYPGYEDHINTSYVGILPLLLAPAGLIAGGWAGLAVAAAGLLALLTALGLEGPLFPLFFDLLPGFRNLHGPVRFLPVLTFATAVAAALGASRFTDTFTTAPAGERRWLLRPAAAATVLVTAAWVLYQAFAPRTALAFPIRNLLDFGFPALALLFLFAGRWIPRRALVVLALLLTFTDQYHFAKERYPDIYGDPATFLDTPPSVRFIRERPGPGSGLDRAVHFTNGFTVQKRVKIDEKILRQQVASVYPNLAALMGTYDAQGVYTLKIERFTDYVRALNGEGRGGRWIKDRLTLLGSPFSPLFDLLNVRYLLTTESNPLPDSAPLESTREGFAFAPSPRPATGMLVDFELPPSSEPTPIRFRIADAEGRTDEIAATPARLATPEFSAFRVYRAEPAAVRMEPAFGAGSPEGAWAAIPGREATVRMAPDAVVVAGDGDPSYRSRPLPRTHRIEVGFEAEPLDRDDTGVYCAFLDASSGAPLYTVVVGDEGYSAVERLDRGVAATRSFHPRARVPFRIGIAWHGDQVVVRLDGRRFVAFRDVDPLDAGQVRIALGSRGGRVALREVTVRVPVEEDRFRILRTRVDFPSPRIPVSFTLAVDGPPDASPFRARPIAVTLLDTDRFEHVYEDEYVTIFENHAAYPRAFLASGYRVLGSDEAVLRELGRPDLDPRSAVLLTRSPGLSLPEGPRPAPPGAAEIVDYRPNRVRIRTECEQESILVLSDVLFPGWEARVDGSETEILRAYDVFRAVPLAAGVHDVEFVYRPRSLRYGAAASAATLGLALLLIAAIRRTRGRRESADPA